jgi:hypothetical protein
MKAAGKYHLPAAFFFMLNLIGIVPFPDGKVKIEG